MLVPAVEFSDLVLAVHILAAIVAFGVTFSYPVFLYVGGRQDPRVMPWFHRMQRSVGRRVVNPGLAVVLLAGIYLASHEHQWHAFYVQWGLAAVVVIGGLEGAAAGGAARTPGAGFRWSDDYEATFKQIAIGGALMNAIVVVTVFLMATHAGA